MCLIQINVYLVHGSYIFEPYVLIIRLAYKKENKYTGAFRIEISVTYIPICIKYIHTKLDSFRNEDDKVCNV
jgi:hypothetical protein